jgi:hypothetical protein
MVHDEVQPFLQIITSELKYGLHFSTVISRRDPLAGGAIEGTTFFLTYASKTAFIFPTDRFHLSAAFLFAGTVALQQSHAKLYNASLLASHEETVAQKALANTRSIGIAKFFFYNQLHLLKKSLIFTRSFRPFSLITMTNIGLYNILLINN